MVFWAALNPICTNALSRLCGVFSWWHRGSDFRDIGTKFQSSHRENHHFPSPQNSNTWSDLDVLEEVPS